MEVSGVSNHRVPCFSVAGIESKRPYAKLSAGVHNHVSFNHRISLKPHRNMISLSRWFKDDGHTQYYSRVAPLRCGGNMEEEKEKRIVASNYKNKKKKLKLLKGLSKDLSVFSDMGLCLAQESNEKKISEAANDLLQELQQLRIEEKQLKKKMKLEKARLKAMRKIDGESSSSSSEASDGECGKVIDVSSLRVKDSEQSSVNESHSLAHEEAMQTLQQVVGEAGSVVAHEEVTSGAICNTQTNAFEAHNSHMLEEECFSSRSTSITSCSNVDGSVGCRGTLGTSAKRIEVCVGGKCKKSGSGVLLEEFERVVGAEGAVVGCKCMGKCRDGPNVRVGLQGVGEGRTQNLPLCIGVGLEDVGVIVANLFSGNGSDLGVITTQQQRPFSTC